MAEIITKTRWEDASEWFNELTDEMNKHVLPGWKDAMTTGYCVGTYIYEPNRRKDGMALRFPGATRGHIEVDNNNIITNIKLYDTACDNCVACYKESVKEAVKQFIGCKIVLEEPSLKG